MPSIDQQLLEELKQALADSRAWARGRRQQISNATRSAHFCSRAAERLYRLVARDAMRVDAWPAACPPPRGMPGPLPGEPSSLRLRHVCTGDDGQRTAGEWMLDAAVVELDACGCPSDVLASMECESSTSLKDFHWDFSKLLHVDAGLRLYLQGINHGTARGATQFIRERCAEAVRLIGERDRTAKWYVGFWPSPECPPWHAGAIDGAPPESIWDVLDEQPGFDHLAGLRLYRHHGGELVEVVAPFPPATS